LSQQLLGVGLVEGHGPGTDLCDRLTIYVVQSDLGAGVGEYEPERQPHMTAATQNDDIDIEHGSSTQMDTYIARHPCGSAVSVPHDAHPPVDQRSQPDQARNAATSEASASS